jgi:D-glycero-alpha-D-manno-heptose-7-phosphate kinase
MFFTGLSRIASEVAGDKIANLDKKKRHVKTMVQMVDEALEIVNNPARPLKDLGELLHESWMLKRELSSKVSTPMIDEIYEAGRSAGAIGGKLLGAGGGGFLYLWCPADKKQEIVRELRTHGGEPVGFAIDMDGARAWRVKES